MTYRDYVNSDIKNKIVPKNIINTNCDNLCVSRSNDSDRFACKQDDGSLIIEQFVCKNCNRCTYENVDFNSLEKLRNAKKENSELWQKGWFVFVRKYLMEELNAGRISAEKAYEIANEFGLEQEDWSQFGGCDD